MESSVVLVNGSKNVVGYDECLNSVLLRHYNHVNRGGVLDCELLGGLCGSSEVSALKQPFNADCAENAQRTAEQHFKLRHHK